LLSHLSQEQSIEVLEANLKLARDMGSHQIHVAETVEQEIMRNHNEMEKHVFEMLERNRKLIHNSLMESCETITPYDTLDMKKVLESQKVMMNEVLTKNAQLVTENSELRMHMSFMPVEYRDYVKNMQASNHQQYRKQRVTPRVIVPNTDHKEGLVDIELEDAPMAHPSVQYFFRDAQYSTLTEARNQMEKGFALRKRQAADIPKREAPWRVDPPPPSVPTPPKTRTSGKSVTPNDLFTNAAYHSVMDSSNTEPYSVPTKQRVPPPQQKATRPDRVSLDYRRADQPPIALIEDSLPTEESSSASPLPNPDLPVDHWRNRSEGRGKGKRPPPQHASRQPLKYARSDDRDYPSSRTAPVNELVIPRPPNSSGATETARQSKTSSRPKLTLREAGIPSYQGEEYQPLTRKECKSHYSIRNPKPLPETGQPISDEELNRVLTKIPDEGDQFINDSDREMSQFVMDRIDQCLTIPDYSIYETMVNGTKKYKTIHGEAVYAKDAFASQSLYRLLDMKMIARVGDYYFSLRMRPDKKSATYEYIPNKRYSYKDVKRTLAQNNIHVTPSRYWSDLALSTLDDHQLHPYFEWCPGSTLELHHMDAQCGLGHIPIGSEIIHRTDLPVLVNGKRKAYVDHRATVARLYQLGVMDSESRESLKNLKAILDKNIDIAKKELERTPFAVAHRTIQIFVNRWKLVSRSLDIVANPPNPYGPKVYNTAELDDRKRKADASSLTVSTPSAASAAEEDGDTTDEVDDDVTMTQQHQQAASDNQDRQNPEGSGGNPV
jgi:hypothetical protein